MKLARYESILCYVRWQFSVLLVFFFSQSHSFGLISRNLTKVAIVIETRASSVRKPISDQPQRRQTIFIFKSNRFQTKFFMFGVCVFCCFVSFFFKTLNRYYSINHMCFNVFEYLSHQQTHKNRTVLLAILFLNGI